MDEKKCVWCASGSGCGHCGYCPHGGWHYWLRWVLGIAIIWLTFWLGMKVGEFKTDYGYGNYGWSGRMMRGSYQYPGGGNFNYGPRMMGQYWSIVSPDDTPVAPTPTVKP